MRLKDLKRRQRINRYYNRKADEILAFKKSLWVIVFAFVILVAVLSVGITLNKTHDKPPHPNVLRTFILKNATGEQKFEHLSSVTLYYDGKAKLVCGIRSAASNLKDYRFFRSVRL